MSIENLMDMAKIPDLVRMVPGLNVAQIKSNVRPAGARGFNSEFSNKLLMVLDRQSAYSPPFSGVFLGGALSSPHRTLVAARGGNLAHSGPRSTEDMPTKVPSTALSPSTSSKAMCWDSRGKMGLPRGPRSGGRVSDRRKAAHGRAR